METKCCRNRNPQTELEKLYFKILETYEGCVLVADKTGKIIFWSGPEPTETFGLTGEEMSSGITLQQMVNMAQQNISPSLNALYTGRVAREIVIPATGTVFQVTSTPVFGDKGELELVVTFAMFDEKQREATEYFAQERNRYMQILTELQGKKMSLSSSKQMVANDVKMQNVLKFADQIARKESCVLITGESGVGKGLIAKQLHEEGNRCEGPFVTVNCGAIPDNLIESELFGYAPGAFTGSRSDGKKGLFEVAQSGTIFLDEISELPLNMQVKLLRVIQEREITPVGGVKPIPIDVRIVSATNRDLQDLVRQDKFREDLYYRLNVVPITVPPLRDRPEDILPLIQSNLHKYNENLREHKVLSSEALTVLLKYPWPGNVRELQNIIERLIITTNDDVISEENLPIFIKQEAETNANTKTDLSLAAAMEKAERDILSNALTNYKSTRAIAKVLQVSQPTIVRKLHKYGLSGSEQ